MEIVRAVKPRGGTASAGGQVLSA